MKTISLVDTGTTQSTGYPEDLRGISLSMIVFDDETIIFKYETSFAMLPDITTQLYNQIYSI